VGPYQKIVIARSSRNEVREKAQYGGVVSVLLIHALEQGLVTSAILTDRGDGISPSGRFAKDRQAVMDCAGSRYSASGSLAALNAAIKNNEEGLGMVGLPCQMEALAKMKKIDPDGLERSDRIRLKVGLFCTWALDYRKLSDFLKSLNIGDPIQKYDIPPPPSQIFQVMSKEDWRDVPLDDVRPLIQKGCRLCQDMTAEWADLSVGTVEGMKEWNTVIIRTQIGLDLMETAQKVGILEIDNLPEENLNHLKEASLNKKRRGHDAKEALKQEEE
jgi:coenzyme F420 hydrogenase subunit beta